MLFIPSCIIAESFGCTLYTSCRFDFICVLLLVPPIDAVPPRHLPVSVGVSTPPVHNNNGVPGYPLVTAAPSVPYGLAAYSLGGYNYIQGVPSNIPQLNVQVSYLVYVILMNLINNFFILK